MISLLERRAAPPTLVRAVLPRVNLLPPEIGERQQMRRVRTGSGLAVLAALAVTGLLHAAAGAQVERAQETVDARTAEHARLLQEAGTYRDVTAVYARTAAAEAMLVDAMAEEVRWSRLLDELSLEVPDGVFLTALSYTQVPVGTGTGTGAGGAGAPVTGTVSASGTALSHDDVASWLRALAAQEGHAGAVLQSATERRLAGRTVVDFVTSVSLTTRVLSDRYVRDGGQR